MLTLIVEQRLLLDDAVIAFLVLLSLLEQLLNQHIAVIFRLHFSRHGIVLGLDVGRWIAKVLGCLVIVIFGGPLDRLDACSKRAPLFANLWN